VSARPIGWDHPDTAHYYSLFQRRFARYRDANRRLVGHAGLAEGMRVLDVASGDGGTAAAALTRLGDAGSVVCFEPAAAMRALGRRALRDARVRWTAAWPGPGERFERVLCGAAIWQLLPLAATLERVFGLLRPGGCLCFDLPASYLGEADDPGGGRDPMLVELPAALAAAVGGTPPGGTARGAAPGAGASIERPPDVDGVDAALAAAGFRATRWTFRTRLGQRAYRAWLKIPPTTDHLLRGQSADERAGLIDRAFASVDAGSWRWERWRGWTAWRPAA
jgi:SAM-dependent methyltransferase